MEGAGPEAAGLRGRLRRPPGALPAPAPGASGARPDARYTF